MPCPNANPHGIASPIASNVHSKQAHVLQYQPLRLAAHRFVSTHLSELSYDMIACAGLPAALSPHSARVEVAQQGQSHNLAALCFVSQPAGAQYQSHHQTEWPSHHGQAVPNRRAWLPLQLHLVSLQEDGVAWAVKRCAGRPTSGKSFQLCVVAFAWM